MIWLKLLVTGSMNRPYVLKIIFVLTIMSTLFRKKANSFIQETLSPDVGDTSTLENSYQRVFPEHLTNNLSTISALYIYTGTPPHGYGTQAPKVAETVLRSEEYNRKKEGRYRNIGGCDVAFLNWSPKEDGPFPHHLVHGNYITNVVRGMSRNFVQEFQTQIDGSIEKTMEDLMDQNADVLTKGRQTFCPIKRQSVTASQAYEAALQFLEENTGESVHTLFDWIKAVMSCFDKPSLRTKMLESQTKECYSYDPQTKQKTKYDKEIRVLKTKTINGQDNVRSLMRDYCTQFASYIKHKERGKKDRRAIASPTMFLRPFLLVVEAFHLELAKQIPGSTISIGGEEKKAKITNNMDTQTLTSGIAKCQVQGTEDATKWNECISPGLFALMHHYFFDPEIRMSCSRAAPATSKAFVKIAWVCHLFQSWKQIQIGPGVMVESEKHYRRIKWTDEEALRMNTRTREWYEKVKHLVTPCREFLYSSGGMLMGMLNAASTTVGLLAANYRMDKSKMRVVTMRSSDDSTTKYLSDTPYGNAQCVEINKQNLSLIGINLSPDKTFFFQAGYAEYTSWYIDLQFVSQFGTEVPSIRPQGKDPADDLFSAAKSTATGLQTLGMNHLGAAIRLRLGVSAVKRLWKLPHLGSNLRNGVSLKVQMIEDGGETLWNCVNCHLNQYCMKERHVKTDEEKEYMLKIINPENPFSEKIEEEVAYSKEHGCLVTEQVVTPRTIFHFVKRSNRTFKGESKMKQAKKENAGDSITLDQVIAKANGLEV